MISFPRQNMQVQGVRPCGHYLMGGFIPMSAMNNLKLDLVLYQIKYIIIIHLFSLDFNNSIN